MPVPFVHMSDIHLGRLHTGGLSEDQLLQRRTDAMLTLLTVLEDVKRSGVPLLLIAGDLFDYDFVDKPTLQEVRDRLADLPTTRVFIAAGNHDYAATDSLYRTLTWPSNVHLFLGEWEAVRVDEVGVTVHGCGFLAPESDTPSLRDYRIPRDTDQLHVVVMHGDLTTGTSRYRPITKDDLLLCGADYVALGHIHASQMILADGALVQAAYSGALEPLDFGEEGPHGYFRGQLEPGGSRLEFVPAAARSYQRVVVDIEGAETMENVLTLVQAALQPVPDTHLVRLVLQGGLAPDFRLDRLRLQPLGERFFAFCVIDETTPGDDMAALADGYSVRSCFVRRMLARIHNETGDEQMRAQKALRAGLDALAGREVRLL